MLNPWNYILPYTCIVTILLVIGIVLAYRNRRNVVTTLLWCGAILQATFIVWLWAFVGYPPLRTMGETRLWYSLFLFASGAILYTKYGFRWITIFTTTLGTIFNIICTTHPEYHSEPLMPILQSVWFVPHVSIYMLSYAILGCATIMCIANLIKYDRNRDQLSIRLTRMGAGLFGIGLLLGCIWAKQAWGDYWSWDPKETWAAIAWLMYLLFIHLRLGDEHRKISYVISILAFVALQMCWWGIKLIPLAVNSAHLY